MKIGILTLPIAENYGGILQAVALYQYLTSQGHDVTLIYKKTERKSWKELIKKGLLLIPFHDLFRVRTNSQLLKDIQKRVDLHKSFISKEIPNISPVFFTTKELKAYATSEKFDAVIVGSDQVWRKEYINDPYYKSFFLDFVPEDTKKIAYAASFGKDHWEGSGDEEEISRLLQRFHAISVRESSGVDICKNTFGIENVQHVLDPTMLMDKEFYLNIIEKADTSKVSAKKLVTYVLDEADEKKSVISQYQENQEITDNDTFHLKGFNKKNITYTVPEWLFSIANADFVITDSFHGMVFAIIFEKEFVVIGNQNRGFARFYSLLSKIGLSERLISPQKKASIPNMPIINYLRTSSLIKNQQLSSLALLYESLY